MFLATTPQFFSSHFLLVTAIAAVTTRMEAISLAQIDKIALVQKGIQTTTLKRLKLNRENWNLDGGEQGALCTLAHA